MAEVYFYIPAKRLDDAVDCGLKLSEWKSRSQATRDGGERPCFVAFLHPKDDERVNLASFRCLKLDLPAEDVIVADNDLYRLSLKYPEFKKKYIDTMISLKDYFFGSFRKPECLVFKTILAEQIRPLRGGLDGPILYESSEALYVNNQLEKYHEKYAETNQALLYSFLVLQEQNNGLRGFRDSEKGLAVFFNQEMNRYITVSIPNFKNLKWID